MGGCACMYAHMDGKTHRWMDCKKLEMSFTIENFQKAALVRHLQIPSLTLQMSKNLSLNYKIQWGYRSHQPLKLNTDKLNFKKLEGEILDY